MHDRGSEFCNNLVRTLCDDFRVRLRVIKAGRPMANGQAESAVKNVKNKIFALCLENSVQLRDGWDGTNLHTALQIIRCDPSSATGYAPAELLMGRKVVYPFELEKREIDMTGTELTMPLVFKLQEIHDRSFATAHKKILKTQAKYKQKYD